ncbi:HotDog domain-containing protein [Podospora australis]|uniref:HotDog domain-containing protein n=1 Tax=Podospora australis TaxID=1536484 RepID=A0AAN6X4Z5_9PEZI|nr:HotDog domain-containing protein [Podospora australis]
MSSQQQSQRQGQGPAVKPHSAPENHNQPVQDPLAHFKAIPWCANILADPSILETIVVDRRPLPSGESNFVRKVMNTNTTVRACISFFQPLSPSSPKALITTLGGVGEDPTNPFLVFNALLDLGEDLTSYAGTMHGGLFAVLMDEVMGTAANFQVPAHGAYTVQFNTSFKRPIKVPQAVLVRGRVVQKKGRKLMVRGAIEDAQGNLMAEAEGLWIAMDRNVGRSQL